MRERKLGERISDVDFSYSFEANLYSSSWQIYCIKATNITLYFLNIQSRKAFTKISEQATSCTC